MTNIYNSPEAQENQNIPPLVEKDVDRIFADINFKIKTSIEENYSTFYKALEPIAPNFGVSVTRKHLCFLFLASLHKKDVKAATDFSKINVSWDEVRQTLTWLNGLNLEDMQNSTYLSGCLKDALNTKNGHTHNSNNPVDYQ